MSTPIPLCVTLNHECERRFTDIEADVKEIDNRQRTHGEKLASLEARVAAWAAVGSLTGGALVTALSRFLK